MVQLIKYSMIKLSIHTKGGRSDMNEEKNNSLNKLAIRTMFFCLVVTIFLSTTFLVVFPATASNMFSKLGAESLSARYAKASYEKSGEFNDLVNTFTRSVQAEEYGMVKKFGKELLDNENFDSFVEFQDNNQPQYVYRVWVEGNYIIALNEIDGLDVAIGSLEIVGTSGYGDISPIKYIADSLSKQISENEEFEHDYNVIDRAYEEVYKNLLRDGEDTNLVIVEAFSMAETFKQDELSTKWLERYSSAKK